MAAKKSASLWWGVGIGFGLLTCAWVALFIAARNTPVATVPLEHKSGGATP